MLTQVTFQFPTDSEVRYLDSQPHPGDRVRGRGRKLFLVSQVSRDGDAYVARCVTPVEYASDVQRLSRTLVSAARALRELAGRLRARALDQRERSARRIRELTRSRPLR